MTSACAQGWFAMLRTQMPFEKWDAVPDENVLPRFGRARHEAWRHCARPIAQINKGDLTAAGDEARQFENSLNDFREKTKRPDPKELRVARLELSGHMESAQGHVNRGLKHTEAASKAGCQLTYTEPAYYPNHVAEALGHAALTYNKTAVADKASVWLWPGIRPMLMRKTDCTRRDRLRASWWRHAGPAHGDLQSLPAMPSTNSQERKEICGRTAARGTFRIGVGFALAAACAFGQPAFMLTGGTVHTVSGAVIENGSVLVREGRIIGVGHDLHAPEGAEVIDLHGQHVYPGMIDSAAMPAGEQLPAARANGVTGVVQISGEEIVPGQIARVAMPGSNVALHLRFPAIATTPIPPHEPQDDDDEPTTAIDREPLPWAQAKKLHDEQLRILNKFFDDARRYQKRKQTGNPRFEAMKPVLQGASPMLVTAVREREIREAIALADKQKIHIILADAYESYKVIPLLKKFDIPVVLGPPLSLPLNDDDAYDRSYTTAAELSKAGVRFSIGTFSQRGIRNLPYQAAATVPFGLSHDEAYKAVSLYPAQIFGLSKRLGSIEEGKSANLIVTDGDPMEASTHVTQVIIEGKPVSLETRQKRLADQYTPPR